MQIAIPKLNGFRSDDYNQAHSQLLVYAISCQILGLLICLCNYLLFCLLLLLSNLVHCYAGITLGFSYAQTRNLLTPITIHAFWNSGVILLLTFLQVCPSVWIWLPVSKLFLGEHSRNHKLHRIAQEQEQLFLFYLNIFIFGFLFKSECSGTYYVL